MRAYSSECGGCSRNQVQFLVWLFLFVFLSFRPNGCNSLLLWWRSQISRRYVGFTMHHKWPFCLKITREEEANIKETFKCFLFLFSISRSNFSLYRFELNELELFTKLELQTLWDGSFSTVIFSSSLQFYILGDFLYICYKKFTWAKFANQFDNFCCIVTLKKDTIITFPSICDTAFLSKKSYYIINEINF